MVMHLWGTQATSHMHSLHFGFGFGALLAPQIAKPFLGPDTENETGIVPIAQDNKKSLCSKYQLMCQQNS